jgi:hypothetical protein
VNLALSQQSLLQDQSDLGTWVDNEDTGAIVQCLEENPILKEQIQWYNRQHELDEKEKQLLNDTIALCKERVEIEKERVEVAEDRAKLNDERAGAEHDAYVAQVKVTEEYKGIIKQQEKEITKAKFYGVAGIVTGLGIAILAILSAL